MPGRIYKGQYSGSSCTISKYLSLAQINLDTKFELYIYICIYAYIYKT